MVMVVCFFIVERFFIAAIIFFTVIYLINGEICYP